MPSLLSVRLLSYNFFPILDKWKFGVAAAAADKGDVTKESEAEAAAEGKEERDEAAEGGPAKEWNAPQWVDDSDSSDDDEKNDDVDDDQGGEKKSTDKVEESKESEEAKPAVNDKVDESLFMDDLDDDLPDSDGD